MESLFGVLPTYQQTMLARAPKGTILVSSPEGHIDRIVIQGSYGNGKEVMEAKSCFPQAVVFADIPKWAGRIQLLLAQVMDGQNLRGPLWIHLPAVLAFPRLHQVTVCTSHGPLSHRQNKPLQLLQRPNRLTPMTNTRAPITLTSLETTVLLTPARARCLQIARQPFMAVCMQQPFQAFCMRQPFEAF